MADAKIDSNRKAELLSTPVEHIDITKHNTVPLVDAMSKMAFSARDLARASMIYDKMLAAKNFQSGLAMLRQIEFAVFDMRLHSDFDPGAGRSALQLLEEVRDRIAVLRPPAYNRVPNSFSHIFAGGYAAGYYSYKWAEVLSADAYGYFEENGILDPKIGGRFRDEILAVGGSRPAAESFRAFRGREPRVEDARGNTCRYFKGLRRCPAKRIVDQVTGRGGERQVPGARTGLAHTLGGPGVLSSVAVLSAPG